MNNKSISYINLLSAILVTVAISGLSAQSNIPELVIPTMPDKNIEKPDFQKQAEERCKGQKTSNCLSGYVPVTAAQMRTIPIARSAFKKHRGLPSKYDLSAKMPPVGSQGGQGSCSAWANIYAIKSYYEAQRFGWEYDPPWLGGEGDHIFSPAFGYNQVNGGSDNGSNAYGHFIQVGKKQGLTPWRYMSYDDDDYRTQPDSIAREQAKLYPIKDFTYLRNADVEAAKAEIVRGNPLSASVGVYPNFSKQAAQVIDSKGGAATGGHAIVIVGYDDSRISPALRHKGAFKFQNSWGRWWGDNGFGWISYKHYQEIGGGYGVLDNGTTPLEDEDIIDNKKELLPPSSVIASRNEYTDKIKVSWSAAENAVSYQVQRSNPGSSSFAGLGYSNTTSYEDKSVQPGVTYRYRIVSVGSESSSNPAHSPVAEGSAKKKDQPGKPGVIANAVFDTNGSGIKISWGAAANATTYSVYRWQTSKWLRLANRQKQTTYHDRSVKEGSYFYVLQAYNNNGDYSFSKTLQVKKAGTNTKPGRVDQLTATRGKYRDKIEVTWAAVSGAEKYVVYRYDFSKKKWVSTFVSSTSYTDSSDTVKNGAYFGYIAQAHNKQGYGEYSKITYGRANPNLTRGGVAPDVPKNVTATIDNATRLVTLTWHKANDADMYNVFRKKSGQKKYRFIKTVNADDGDFQEKFPGRAGDLYLYSVRAQGMLTGESDFSDPAAVYVNRIIPAINHRISDNAGFNRFKGNWQGVGFVDRVTALDVKMTFEYDNGKFIAKLIDTSRGEISFTGTYTADSTILEATGFEARLTSDDTLVLFAKNPEFSKDEFMLTFVKK